MKRVTLTKRPRERRHLSRTGIILFPFFAAGYVELPDIFRVGFVMAIVNAVIWGGVGTIWWKFLGLY
ncbi:hypothetical protein GIB67_031447 [Kingdonia uniflora]|uniref:Uncharacterized protein n=1 Tax=Kingdonia uniflora TaxID=39325 RepID=A0A7J7MB49_9MAGN|nr:hypothetical protein GIB67_031447 [Kingdonia uniflora]